MKASNILMLACVVFSINVRQTTSQGGGLMQGLVDFAMLNPVDPNAAGPVPLDSAFPPDTSFPPDAFPPDTGPSSDPSSSAGPFPPETVAQVNTGLPLNQRQTDINPPRNTDVLPPGISLDPLTPVDPAWQTNSLPPNDGTPIDSNFPSDPFSSNAGMPIDPVSQTDPFSSNAGMPIDPVSQTDPFSSNAGMPIDPFSQTDPFSSNAGMPIDPVSQTDPFSSNTGMPIDPVSQTDPFSSNTGMPIDPVSQTDPFSSNAGMPIDPVSQTDPMQTNDGIPLDPAFQEDPFAADPFASDPFGPDPFASDPFASDASAPVRDATTITEGSPFFRFLPNIPPGSAFVSLNDGTTNTFQPTDNWIGEKPVGAGKLDQNAIDPNVADTHQTKVESIIPSKDVGTVPIGSSPMSPPVPATGGQQNAMKDWVVPVKEAKQIPVPIFPMASPDATNVEPVVSANGPVVDSHAIPLGPENPNAIPIWQVDPNAVPLGPVDSNAIPLGPVDPNAIPLGPVDLNTIPLGPVVDQNARPLRPLVDPDPVSLRPVVDTNAIPLGPIFATPVNLSPVDGKQNQGQSPGASSDVPGNWMQLYTRDRKRPRRLPPVQQEVSEPLPLTPTDNLMAQASLNSFTRNRGLYRRLREERRQARRQRKLERQRQKQQQRQQKKERKQARNQRLENRGSIGRVVTSTGPVGAKVARMIIPGQNRPFVGKRQRGRRMVPPCTQRRQQRGLCSPDQLPPRTTETASAGQQNGHTHGQPLRGTSDHGGWPVNGVQIVDPTSGHGRGRPPVVIETPGSGQHIQTDPMGVNDHAGWPVNGVQILDPMHDPTSGNRGHGRPPVVIETPGSGQHIDNVQTDPMGVNDHAGWPVNGVQILDPLHDPTSGNRGHGRGGPPVVIETPGSGQHTDPLIGVNDHGGWAANGVQIIDPTREQTSGNGGHGRGRPPVVIETPGSGQHSDPFIGVNVHAWPANGVQIVDPMHEPSLGNNRNGRGRPPVVIETPGSGQHIDNVHVDPMQGVNDHAGWAANGVQILDPLHEPSLGNRGHGGVRPPVVIETPGSDHLQGNSVVGVSDQAGWPVNDLQILDPVHEPSLGNSEHGGVRPPGSGQHIDTVQADPMAGVSDHGGWQVNGAQIANPRPDPPLNYKGRGDRQLPIVNEAATGQQIDQSGFPVNGVQILDPVHEPSLGNIEHVGGRPPVVIETPGSGQPIDTVQGDHMVGLTDHGGWPVNGGQVVDPQIESPLNYKGRDRRKPQVVKETPVAGQHIDIAHGEPLMGVNDHGSLPVQIMDPQHDRPWRNRGRGGRKRGRNARNRRKQRKNRRRGGKGKLRPMTPNMQDVGPDLLPLDLPSNIQHSDVLDPVSGIPVGHGQSTDGLQHGIGFNQEPQHILDPQIPANVGTRQNNHGKRKKLGKAGKNAALSNDVLLVDPDPHTVFDPQMPGKRNKNNNQKINRRGRKNWRRNKKQNKGRKQKGPKLRRVKELTPVDISPGDVSSKPVVQEKKATTPYPAHYINIPGLGYIDFGTTR